MSLLIYATIDGHPCIVQELEIHQDFRTLLGYEQIGEPFPCPGCGAVHELKDERWTNCTTQPSYYEDGEPYKEVVCAYCTAPLKPPLQAKDYVVHGPSTSRITVACIQREWVLPGVAHKVECRDRPAIAGQYFVKEFSGHTAKLVGTGATS